uniref:N-acetyltransferase domain-containing protein n=1 Tax=Chromera velia CCMP2878 TaxID=1169474 RepID=A0A0G4GQM8_9ALVE|eukprot:Cvel_5060.t1-p1 / transcript=Cvel_5060.t1 / gene=Cvel_5060 / organism=Chromera_velia_CCMP2878 / gene_product=hypothetical protein / transcript_product=hypothetical protein / location=Cvel_scaffold230:84517-87056(+) / protein_length=329 / sequence_SO=supercontig / SO=protein_coding / is_pseudo=false
MSHPASDPPAFLSQEAKIQMHVEEHALDLVAVKAKEPDQNPLANAKTICLDSSEETTTDALSEASGPSLATAVTGSGVIDDEGVAEGDICEALSLLPEDPTVSRADSVLSLSSKSVGGATALPAASSCVVLEDVSLCASSSSSGSIAGSSSSSGGNGSRGESHPEVLRQANRLCQKTFFEDCTKGASRKNGWRLSCLVTSDVGNPVLRGFLLWRSRPSLEVLEIAKLAVPEEMRGKGYGKRLLKYAMETGKKNPNIRVVALSSLKDAVPFYLRLGFRKDDRVTASLALQKENDPSGQVQRAAAEGQVYLEWPCGRRRPAAEKKKKGGKK